MARQRIVTWKSSISSRSLRASENPTLPRGVIFFFTFLFSFVNPLFWALICAPLRLYRKMVHMI